ncbi:MAG: hypothetical protein ACI841_001839 [Planctomycetota bacterium]|jgi:hypothetical protein
MCEFNRNGCSSICLRKELEGGGGDLLLHTESAPPNQPGLFFQGANPINGGMGTLFGDVLRCASSTAERLEIRYTDTTGSASTTIDALAVGNVMAGQTWNDPYWYRDPIGGPCGTAFNLTNAVEIQWLP